jgi:acetyl esterase/lipase
MGVSAFVLKYRLPSDAIMKDKSVGPLQDVQEAIRIVRRNAKDWNINPRKIGIMGFSAGGHLASTASTHFTDKVYEVKDTTSARPDFSILIYPVISMDTAITHRGSRDNLIGKNPSKEQVVRFSNELQVNSNTPPAFLVHATDDNTVPVQNSMNYLLALKKNKVPGELHIYEKGGHGFGLGANKGTAAEWPNACKSWLKVKGLL